MGVPCTWPTAVSAIGPTAVGSLLWENHGQIHLSVAVKARFALRHNAPMLIAKAQPLAVADAHDGANPTRSLVCASDMVPYRPMADVWLTGHAHAPRARSVAVSVVRLALYRGPQVLLDKVLHVVGDRAAEATTPEPFVKMPLVYERAYGGAGFDGNPVGVGAAGSTKLPNFVHPEHPDRVAGLGPISRYWKVRRGSVDGETRRLLEREIPRVPEGFDWEYFHAAPKDQRVAFLSGDEWLVLDGVHPNMLRMQSRLPKARGVARVLSVRGHDQGDALAMVADALAIDADEQTCSITWRGSMVVESLEQLGDILVAGAVEVAGRAVDWDEARSRSNPGGGGVAVARALLERSAVSILSADRELQSDELDMTSIDASDDAGVAVEEGELITGTYQRLEVDSGEWSADGWPSFPLASDADEVTETKTRADMHRPVADARPTEVEQPSKMPLAVDTERDEPPELNEDELPWITEVAVEPEAPADDVTDRAADSESVGVREASPGKVAAKLSSTGPVKRLPPRPRKKSEPAAAMLWTRGASLPPAPLDEVAYAESLRRAGAGEDDVEKVLQALRADPEPPSS